MMADAGRTPENAGRAKLSDCVALCAALIVKTRGKVLHNNG